MGYQESWVYIEPQWNFKNLIRAYEQAKPQVTTSYSAQNPSP